LESIAAGGAGDRQQGQKGAGYYFEPTILLASSAGALRAEEFWPGTVRSQVQNEEEAVALANGTAYAFAAGISRRILAGPTALRRKSGQGGVVNTYRSFAHCAF
jgi:aldehyde dehydrogenase (NAD+)